MAIGVADINQAAVVKRWQIVDTGKRYSIAEHSFRVAIISMAIARHLGFSVNIQNACAVRALHHDLDEIITGDIPTPIKDYLNRKALYERVSLEMERRFEGLFHADDSGNSPVSIVVKIADYVDTLFELLEAQKKGHDVGTIRGYVRDSMMDYMHSMNKIGPEGIKGRLLIMEIPFGDDQTDVDDFVMKMLEKPVTRVF